MRDTSEALAEARAKLQEQDEFLRQITAAGLLYGTIVGRDGAGYALQTSGGMHRVNLTVTAKTGDTVLVQPETKQILEISTLQPLGATAVLQRDIGNGRWEVGAGNDIKICTIGDRLDRAQLQKGARVILDPSGYVAVAILPKDRTLHATEATNVLWDHIGGQEVAKLQLREAIAFIRGGNKIFNAYNAKAPKGLLLYGPPGCGKTLLGKAVATDLAGDGQGAFMYVKGPEILNMFVGNSEAAIRGIFQSARAYKQDTGRPAVVFIDEADAVLSRRGSGISSDMEKTMVPSFLTEMDGLAESSALVILATNRADTLDPAIIRDGRIDAKIPIARPGINEVREIFHINLKGLPLSNGYRHGELADEAAAELFRPPADRNISGAMVSGVVQRAVRVAIRRDVAAGRVGGLARADLSAAIAEVAAEYC